ncbi:probable WRKY transcription factor 27 [Solanum pennellii]|uniref:Probable WRKY transcription factor 27 n=1 Tax=Solanum pennellii TaxID=28526 RepID=A0ABM1GBB1_SOLPN|nr:probable WRKY transcription factor 27 [Solanum pennellii]
MEDNDWDLSAVVRSCNIINKSTNVTASENDSYTFEKTLDFSVGREKKSNDQVVITNQNQEIRDQSPRVFNEVLQEELTDDKWAWQKYGQKSIKGSPFPRNYFKCSASNCKATKIIEKSPKNEKYFLVSYSDVHNHDPPPSRRSLALYNNISKRRLPKSINIVPKALKLNASSSSSSSSSSKRAKRFKVDASPTAPKPEIKKTNEMVDDVVVENKGDIIEEEEITYDKIFMDFENSNKLYI